MRFRCEQDLSAIQRRILAELEVRRGRHILGPALARACGCSVRTVRAAIRSLRCDLGRSDILSRAGGEEWTDGYWISADPAEIAANRRYHQAYGMDYLFRVSLATVRRAASVARVAGQGMMDFGDGATDGFDRTF